ncbi:DUF3180 domain-containing protein [Ruicaihuangia caeni]|uniref:DUF3180 domain-containing protein n=1 Tax=Ruicaihuangia caeni TaxID=3042517 RepID=UPI00338F9B70
MKRTGPVSLLVLAVIGLAAGIMLDTGLAAAGRPVFVPPITLAVALALIGAVLVALARPVRKAVKARTLNAIDPFYAIRVLVLAKASSLAGSLIGGFGIGVIVYLLSRSVVAAGGAVLLSAASVVGGAALVTGALIAERMCSLPPGDEHGDGDSNAEKDAARRAGREREEDGRNDRRAGDPQDRSDSWSGRVGRDDPFGPRR